MLTGDNPLTACHVAKELQISKKKLLVLTLTEDSGWVWQSVSGATTAAVETKPSVLGGTYDLCLTGDVRRASFLMRVAEDSSPLILLSLHLQGLKYLLSVDNGKAFRSILPYVKVFARVAPKQKVQTLTSSSYSIVRLTLSAQELIVTTYKSMGFYTLMCGDGTNDVGALKHAHVGECLYVCHVDTRYVCVYFCLSVCHFSFRCGSLVNCTDAERSRLQEQQHPGQARGQ